LRHTSRSLNEDVLLCYVISV